MLRYHLLIIYRNFKRYKSSFFINLIGLTTGLVCALLIYLWVNDELKVDEFHENGARLFQVMENTQVNGNIITDTGTPDILAENMIMDFPEIENAIEVVPSKELGSFMLSNGNKHIKAFGQYAGKDYFKMFSFPLIHGNAEQVLSEKSSIVISKSLAMKLFNSTENVVGRLLDVHIFNFNDPMIVSGVFQDIPANSTEKFDFVLTWEMWENLSQKIGRQVDWNNFGPNAFLLLKEGTEIKEFNSKIADYIKSKNKDANTTIFAARYSDYYLYGNYENGVQAGGRIEYVKLFSVVALFILLISCINFINLSTARASQRIKEVGVKKVIGAGRRSLIFHYLGESFLLTLLSLSIALLIVFLFLPQFNRITGKYLSLHLNGTLLLIIWFIAIATGLLSGSYPAFHISSFNPAFILKGKILRGSIVETWIRKGLVIFQFTVSVVLVVSVIVVNRQVNYLQTKNLGYNKENIIYFDIEGKVSGHQEAFLQRLRNLPGINNACSTNSSFMGHNNSTSGLWWPNKDPDDIIQFEVVTIGYDLMETLGIKMKVGRSFSRDFPSDSEQLIFNEAAIKAMRLNDPVGQMVRFWGVDQQILGVVEDFHFESLHEKVNPLVFRLAPDETSKVMARIAAGREKETLKRLEDFYGKFNPGYTFDYRFLDQEYHAQYVAEKRVRTLSRYFAGFGIIISCLGLFGLATSTAEQKTKEIGIRKVLGCGGLAIANQLTVDFTRLVVISIVIAIPVGYFVIHQWLESFAYHIHLKWWYFVGAGFITLLIAWFTVGIQTVKAALINPAECLKEE